MSNSNRLIQIAQQPPAIVSRGDLFSFIAYFPKSSPYVYGRYQEDVQAHHARAGQDGFTTTLYSNGGFATANVIPADDRKLRLKNRNDGMVIGMRRADFNPTNEDDRTVRFELGITRTGTFIVVVRLHKKQMRNSREGDRIITSVVTRKIQVVEQQEQTDTRSNHARYGRLTPPSMGREEEEEHHSFDIDESKLLRTDTRFNGECDLPRRARLIMPRPRNVTLPEAENSGLNDGEDKKSQPISASTLHQQNARRDGSEPSKDSWSDDDDSDDEGGVNLPSRGRLIMPHLNSTLAETKSNDGDNCSDADDSDAEGGIKCF